ncbi:hypothetical protein O9993_15325 [Vibrio lentus]|nr:hypothetical protein [Vibrio lentus]
MAAVVAISRFMPVGVMASIPITNRAELFIHYRTTPVFYGSSLTLKDAPRLDSMEGSAVTRFESMRASVSMAKTVEIEHIYLIVGILNWKPILLRAPSLGETERVHHWQSHSSSIVHRQI